MNTIEKNKGFTLIELVVAIALLTTVFILAGSILGVGTRILTDSQNQRDLQVDARSLKVRIADQIKYADGVEILDTLPETYEVQKRYIYMTDQVVYYKVGNDVPTQWANLDDSQASHMVFTKNSNTDVNVNLDNQNASLRYDLNFDSEAVNLKGTGNKTSVIGDQGSVLVLTYSSSEKSFTLFNLRSSENPDLDIEVVGRITSNKVKLYVPHGTDLSDLVPYFETTGDAVNIGGSNQVTGVSSVDFSSGTVTYTIVAKDGSVKDYEVDVEWLPENKPAANGVRIIATDKDEEGNDEIVPIPWKTSTLTGNYTYISNGNGQEDTSENGTQYQWYYADSENGTYYPIPNAIDKTFKPTDYENKWIKFSVNPISETGATGGWSFSQPVQIYNGDTNRLWRKMVSDLWYMYASEADREQFEKDRLEQGQPPYKPTVEMKVRKEIETLDPWSSFKPDPTFSVKADPSDQSVVLEGTTTYFGSYLAIDLSDFASDLDTYSLVFDTKLFIDDTYDTSGWGMALNGKLDSKNRDASYMFQFDPGAKGFVVRRDNYTSYSIPDLGVSQIGEKAYGDDATYNPTEIVTPNQFTWSGNDDKYNSEWIKDYSTRLTIQRQLDGSLIIKANTWETAKGESNDSQEMWFGDFGSISYNNETFNGVPVTGYESQANSEKAMYDHYDSSEGSYLGFRSWRKQESKKYKAKFINLELEDGFSMSIDHASYVIDTDFEGNESSNKVMVVFDSEIRSNDFHTDLMKFSDAIFGGQDGQITSVSTMPFDDKAILVTFDKNIPKSVYDNTEKVFNNSIARGGVRALHAGDVKIVNGGNFGISEKVIFPYMTVENQNYSGAFLSLDTNTGEAKLYDDSMVKGIYKQLQFVAQDEGYWLKGKNVETYLRLSSNYNRSIGGYYVNVSPYSPTVWYLEATEQPNQYRIYTILKDRYYPYNDIKYYLNYVGNNLNKGLDAIVTEANTDNNKYHWEIKEK